MIFNLVGYAATDTSERHSLDSVLLGLIRIVAMGCASLERGPISGNARLTDICAPKTAMSPVHKVEVSPWIRAGETSGTGVGVDESEGSAVAASDQSGDGW